jgi:crotonobetainyl-CoA:carnitine CoA-transferase CaiB-like acyl-CoA transferase
MTMPNLRETESAPIDRPLAGLRIVDAVRGPLAPITRYLAELGATVDRFDGPGAIADLLTDAANNAGKRRHASDIDTPAAHDVLMRADAIVASTDQPIDLRALRAARPALVTMAVSDFGTDTTLTDWQATGLVLHALSSELSRSGIRGHAPLPPPGDLAYQCAASQGAYVLATALYRALHTGQGDHLDFSALDGAVQALDPGFGISGSATMGKPAHLLSRDRPVRGIQYPILPCADGYVRICVLAKRQWQGMFRWMGEPAAFASPEFDNLGVRYKSRELLPAIAAFFSNRKRAELEEEGQRYGVPIAAILTFEECIATDHMRERQAFVDAPLVTGETALLPNGVINIDGARMGPVQPTSPDNALVRKAASGDALPFQGLRVLDLGVIVVGAETGRLLADGGADVIKVESRAYPDGNRQSHLSYGLSVSFAAGHRNKRSLAIDLRSDAGRALFLQLVAETDIVLSNFKPGTMASLGFGPDVLAAINPGIIMVDSSAFGTTGPWSKRMGYGPLVRAATGLTLGWRYPDDPAGYSDSVTIYPDHVAARVGALAAVALLIRRLRISRGGSASVAQAEVMLAHFAPDVARAARKLPIGQQPDAPWGVFQAAGDDDWCVVTIRGNADWQALNTVIDFGTAASADSPAARLAARDAIHAAVAHWVGERTAETAMMELQAAGVPAARMLRVADLPDFPYYRERGLFRVESHPYLDEAVVAERWSVKRDTQAETPTRPAPLAGEHSLAVVADWLNGSVDGHALVAAGVLDLPDDETLAAAQARGVANA